MSQPYWQQVQDPTLREVIRRLQEQIDTLRQQVNKGA